MNKHFLPYKELRDPCQYEYMNIDIYKIDALTKMELTKLFVTDIFLIDGVTDLIQQEIICT